MDSIPPPVATRVAATTSVSFCALAVALAAPARAQDAEDMWTVPPEVIEAARSALLNFEGPDGRVRLDINVETRGNWRRNDRNCDFVPLWLDLDRDDEDLIGTVLEGQNRLKLYVTCNPGSDRFEEYIDTEYVIYPAHNRLTDLSFRARPARVTYIDVSGDQEPFTSNASRTRWRRATRPCPSTPSRCIRPTWRRTRPRSWSCSTMPWA